MVLAHLVLGPRNLPWFVVFNLAVVTGLAVIVTSTDSAPTSRIVIGVGVIFVVGFIVLLDLVPTLPARRRRRDRRVDAGRPARPDHEPGHAAGTAAGLVRRVGAAVGRWHAVRRRLRGRRPSRDGASGSSSASATSPARARRPAPARCCSPARSVACSPRCRPPSSCRPPTSTSSASTGSRASRPRSTSPSTSRPATSRSAPPATRRPPSCGPAPAAGWCTSPRVRRSGIIEGAEFVPVRGRLDRGDAVLLYTDGMVETRGRDIQSGHRPDARPERPAAPAGLRERRPPAHRHGGHPERRPGPVAGAPALIDR